MSRFTVEVKNRQVVDALRRGNLELTKAVDFAVQRTAQGTGRKMAMQAPKFLTTLASSIKPDRIGLMVWRVGPHVNYADYVENGGKPGGFPSLRAIASWINVKGITPRNPDFSQRDLAWVIRRKIGQRGTAAQPFVKPVFDSGFPQQRLQKLVEQAASKTLKQAGL